MKLDIKEILEDSGEQNAEQAINQLVNFLRNASSVDDPMEGMAFHDLLTDLYRNEGIVKDASDKDVELLEDNLNKLVEQSKDEDTQMRMPNWIVGVTMKAIEDAKGDS